MDHRLSACRGCLLGIAAGDAMGYTVDPKHWTDICRDYGENGLLGYDLANGQAEVSAYTQYAAYIANGLLLGTTLGKHKQYPRFMHLAAKEWIKRQNTPRLPEKDKCWISAVPQLRRRRCRDSWMLDALRFNAPGTLENPINKADYPGSLTAAAMVGLAYDSRYLQPPEVGILGAKAVAMTHGDPETVLCGAVLALLIAALVQEPDSDLKTNFIFAVDAMEQLFADRFPQAAALSEKLKKAVENTDPEADHQQILEHMHCFSAAECLAGAVYTGCVCGDNFDAAMIIAVNHSGRSAAVGTLTGAILGAQYGAEILPDFYLENLEVARVLQVLARDLAQGSPSSGLFDDDWDMKYIQGPPVLP